jgi:hypothetical protein
MELTLPPGSHIVVLWNGRASEGSNETGATSPSAAPGPDDFFEQTTIVLIAASSTTGIRETAVTSGYLDAGIATSTKRSCSSYTITGGHFLGFPYTATPTGFTLFQSVSADVTLYAYTKQ